MNEMAAFHRAIHADPDEATPQLAYADWLDGSGFPAAAHMIRTAHDQMRQNSRGSHFRDAQTEPLPRDYAYTHDTLHVLPPGAFRVMHISGPGVEPKDGSLFLTHKSAANPDRHFTWLVEGLPNEHAAQLVHGLRREGGHISELTDQRFPAPAEPQHYDEDGEPTYYGSTHDIPAVVRAHEADPHESTPGRVLLDMVGDSDHHLGMPTMERAMRLQERGHPINEAAVALAHAHMPALAHDILGLQDDTGILRKPYAGKVSEQYPPLHRNYGSHAEVPGQWHRGRVMMFNGPYEQSEQGVQGVSGSIKAWIHPHYPTTEVLFDHVIWHPHTDEPYHVRAQVHPVELLAMAHKMPPRTQKALHDWIDQEMPEARQELERLKSQNWAFLNRDGPLRQTTREWGRMGYARNHGLQQATEAGHAAVHAHTGARFQPNVPPGIVADALNDHGLHDHELAIRRAEAFEKIPDAALRNMAPDYRERSLNAAGNTLDSPVFRQGGAGYGSHEAAESVRNIANFPQHTRLDHDRLAQLHSQLATNHGREAGLGYADAGWQRAAAERHREAAEIHQRHASLQPGQYYWQPEREDLAHWLHQLGSPEEAALLRSPQHVMIHEGKIVPAGFAIGPVHQAAEQAMQAAGIQDSPLFPVMGWNFGEDDRRHPAMTPSTRAAIGLRDSDAYYSPIPHGHVRVGNTHATMGMGPGGGPGDEHQMDIPIHEYPEHLASMLEDHAEDNNLFDAEPDNDREIDFHAAVEHLRHRAPIELPRANPDDIDHNAPHARRYDADGGDFGAPGGANTPISEHDKYWPSKWRHMNIKGVNYALGDEEGFHAAIHAHPNEDTVRFAYADWLEDNNRGAEAHHIRRNAEQMRGGVPAWRIIRFPRGGSSEGFNSNPQLPRRAFLEANAYPKEGEPVTWRIELHHNSLHPEGKPHYYGAIYHEHEVGPMLAALHDEGVAVNPYGDEYRDPDEHDRTYSLPPGTSRREAAIAQQARRGQPPVAPRDYDSDGQPTVYSDPEAELRAIHGRKGEHFAQTAAQIRQMIAGEIAAGTPANDPLLATGHALAQQMEAMAAERQRLQTAPEPYAALPYAVDEDEEEEYEPEDEGPDFEDEPEPEDQGPQEDDLVTDDGQRFWVHGWQRGRQGYAFQVPEGEDVGEAVTSRLGELHQNMLNTPQDERSPHRYAAGVTPMPHEPCLAPPDAMRRPVNYPYEAEMYASGPGIPVFEVDNLPDTSQPQLRSYAEHANSLTRHANQTRDPNDHRFAAAAHRNVQDSLTQMGDHYRAAAHANAAGNHEQEMGDWSGYSADDEGTDYAWHDQPLDRTGAGLSASMQAQRATAALGDPQLDQMASQAVGHLGPTGGGVQAASQLHQQLMHALHNHHEETGDPRYLEAADAHEQALTAHTPIQAPKPAPYGPLPEFSPGVKRARSIQLPPGGVAMPDDYDWFEVNENAGPAAITGGYGPQEPPYAPPTATQIAARRSMASWHPRDPERPLGVYSATEYADFQPGYLNPPPGAFDVHPRRARTADPLHASLQALARALLHGEYGHSLNHGGGVAGAYGYPAFSEGAAAFATPDGTISLGRGWSGAQNMTDARAAEAAGGYDFRPPYDNRFGDVRTQEAIQRLLAAHKAGQELQGQDRYLQFRAEIHPEMHALIRGLARPDYLAPHDQGQWGDTQSGVLGDYLGDHGHAAESKVRGNSLTGALKSTLTIGPSPKQYSATHYADINLGGYARSASMAAGIASEIADQSDDIGHHRTAHAMHKRASHLHGLAMNVASPEEQPLHAWAKQVHLDEADNHNQIAMNATGMEFNPAGLGRPIGQREPTMNAAQTNYDHLPPHIDDAERVTGSLHTGSHSEKMPAGALEHVHHFQHHDPVQAAYRLLDHFPQAEGPYRLNDGFRVYHYMPGAGMMPDLHHFVFRPGQGWEDPNDRGGPPPDPTPVPNQPAMAFSAYEADPDRDNPPPSGFQHIPDQDDDGINMEELIDALEDACQAIRGVDGELI